MHARATRATAARAPAARAAKRSLRSLARRRAVPETEAERDLYNKDWPLPVANSSFDEMHGFYAKNVLRNNVNPNALVVEEMNAVPALVHVDDAPKNVPTRSPGDVEPAAVIVDADDHVVATLSWDDAELLAKSRASTVGEFLLNQEPPPQAILLEAKRTVADAAAMLLKYKVESVVVANKTGQAVGVVNRSIFLTGQAEGFDAFQ